MHIAQNYGLTINQYNNMLRKQDYKCAICGAKQNKGYTKDNLCIDHDHKTGVVRGILCDKCNMAMGVFDELEKLNKAILYLTNAPKGINLSIL